MAGLMRSKSLLDKVLIVVALVRGYSVVAGDAE
jgi:hypothetical protein